MSQIRRRVVPSYLDRRLWSPRLAALSGRGSASTMRVLSTWNEPSAVYFSAKLGATVLVLARASRIEIVRLLEDGLSHVCGTDLWGQITSLSVLNESVCQTIYS